MIGDFKVNDIVKIIADGKLKGRIWKVLSINYLNNMVEVILLDDTYLLIGIGYISKYIPSSS